MAIPDTTGLRSKADAILGMRDAAKSRLASVHKEIKALQGELEELDLVVAFFRTMIDKEITEGVQVVERLLTEGLQAVFDDYDLSVKANVEIERGKVSVDLMTQEKQVDGTVVSGVPNDTFGGAVVTVQSVLLRITIIVKRGLRRLLLLDESLPAIDGSYLINMGKFLSALCDRLGLDILVVSHNPTLVESSQKGYRIKKVRGVASFDPIVVEGKRSHAVGS